MLAGGLSVALVGVWLAFACEYDSIHEWLMARSCIHIEAYLLCLGARVMCVCVCVCVRVRGHCGGKISRQDTCYMLL